MTPVPDRANASRMPDEDEGVRALHSALNTRRSQRSDAMIRELAYNCAGIGAGAVMQQAPDVVMPTEQITAAVDALLALKFDIGAAADA